MALFAILVVGTLSAGDAVAGAQSDCGEFSYGFDGTRLLNDGISGRAGPFPIDLPEGLYDVSMRSHDAHDEHRGQADQREEQWYFVLDSGYTSPLTPDVPDDGNTAAVNVTNQPIGASTAITVIHRGVGNVNSVDVVCVGFTPATAEPVPELTNAIAEPASIQRPKPVVGVSTVPESVPRLALTGPSFARQLGLLGLALLLGGLALTSASRRPNTAKVPGSFDP